MTADVKILARENDPEYGHAMLDKMLAETEGRPVSVFVVVYEAGMVPQVKYCGRSLTLTETRGVLATLLAAVGT